MDRPAPGFEEYAAVRRDVLVRSAVLIGCPPADAEDVVQVVLTRCHRQWRRVVAAERPDAYVHRMLINAVHDSRRRRRWREQPAESLPEPPPVEATHPGRDRPRARCARGHGQVPHRPCPGRSRDQRPHRQESVMLTESEVRTLLGRAADTVAVSPPTPRRQRPGWRRAAVLAAAAVAAAVGAGATLANLAGHDPAQPVTAPTPAPTVDTTTASGTVPTVFGYRRQGAVGRLTSAGYRVRVRAEVTCLGAGRAVATTPAPGVRLAPGSTVVLTVGKAPAAATCVRPEATVWPFLDHADGRGPWPTLLARAVTVYVNGERYVVGGPSGGPAWADTGVDDVLRSAIAWSPAIDRSREVCPGQALPAAVADRDPLDAVRLTPQLADGPCVSLALYSSRAAGGVDTVVLTSAGLRVSR